jgi:Pin2-interacting protein X1
MLGIGAAHARDPNGIAWKQNSDFERLLARLNGDEDAAAMKVDGFARATEEMGTVAEVVDEEAEGRVRKEKKREEKKKRNAEEMENGSTAAVPAVEVVTLTTRVPPRG